MPFGELTKLKLGATLVAGVSELSGPQSSVAEVENTPLGATHKRFRPSKVSEAGTISVRLFWEPTDATHVTIRDYADVPETVAWTVEYSDGTEHAFNAFVTSANITGGEQETDIMCEVELRIDGGVTETVGTI